MLTGSAAAKDNGSRDAATAIGTRMLRRIVELPRSWPLPPILRRPNDPQMTTRTQPVHVIGGGLAGSEAAWQLAQASVPVVLHEMRPLRATAAHKTDGYAELVCSNSFRSDDKDHNAVGLLHAEMRRLGSLIMRAADSHQVPAGGALAVDRDGFSAAVSAALASQPLITLERGEVALPPAEWDSVIVATGPLTSPDLAASIRALTGEDALAFFDAIAPIVHRESIDLEQAWFQSRYDKSRARRLRRRLHQLPAVARTI